jgi:hypothetical protein
MRIFSCTLPAISLRLVYGLGCLLLIRIFSYEDSYSMRGSWLLSLHCLLSSPNPHYAGNCSQRSLKVILSNFCLMLCSCLVSLPGQKSKEQRNYVYDGGISANRRFLSNFVVSGLESVVNNHILINYISVDRSSSLASNERIFGSVAGNSIDSNRIPVMIAALIPFLLALESYFSIYRYRVLVHRSI